MEKIVLGGGCFWCLDAAFRLVDGVEQVLSGYSGGHVANPSYEAVTTGTTGHAEVIEVVFNPDKVSLATLLDLFWKLHDPTSLNRQGADVGTQYRSAIYYTSETQKAEVMRSIEGIADDYTKPIVTEVAALDVFYPAEDYHQDYFNKNPSAGYCQFVVAPKVRKARKFLENR